MAAIGIQLLRRHVCRRPVGQTLRNLTLPRWLSKGIPSRQPSIHRHEGMPTEKLAVTRSLWSAEGRVNTIDKGLVAVMLTVFVFESPHPISVCMLIDSLLLLIQFLAKPKSHSLMRAGSMPSRSVLSSFKSLRAALSALQSRAGGCASSSPMLCMPDLVYQPKMSDCVNLVPQLHRNASTRLRCSASALYIASARGTPVRDVVPMAVRHRADELLRAEQQRRQSTDLPANGCVSPSAAAT